VTYTRGRGNGYIRRRGPRFVAGVNVKIGQNSVTYSLDSPFEADAMK